MLPSQNSRIFVVVTVLMRSVSSTGQISATININNTSPKSHNTLSKLTNTGVGVGVEDEVCNTEWQLIFSKEKNGMATEICREWT
jgi:hypothetical protein